MKEHSPVKSGAEIATGTIQGSRARGFEGVPRYITPPFSLEDGIYTFKQIRTYGKKARYLCPPQDIPLPVQDVIAASADITTTKACIDMLLYFTHGRDESKQEQKQASRGLLKDFSRRLRMLKENPRERGAEVFSRTQAELEEIINKGTGADHKTADLAFRMSASVAYAVVLAEKYRGEIYNTPQDQLNVSNLSQAQREIIMNCGYYAAWESLQALGDPRFQKENPFQPILEMFGYGFTNISFPRSRRKEYIMATKYQIGKFEAEQETMLQAA